MYGDLPARLAETLSVTPDLVGIAAKSRTASGVSVVVISVHVCTPTSTVSAYEETPGFFSNHDAIASRWVASSEVMFGEMICLSLRYQSISRIPVGGARRSRATPSRSETAGVVLDTVARRVVHKPPWSDQVMSIPLARAWSATSRTPVTSSAVGNPLETCSVDVPSENWVLNSTSLTPRVRSMSYALPTACPRCAVERPGSSTTTPEQRGRLFTMASVKVASFTPEMPGT